MYLFVNFPPSLFKIALADSVLETKTCVSPNRFVLKQLPYLKQLARLALINYGAEESDRSENANGRPEGRVYGLPEAADSDEVIEASATVDWSHELQGLSNQRQS